MKAVPGTHVLVSTKDANTLVTDGFLAHKEWLEKNPDKAGLSSSTSTSRIEADTKLTKDVCHDAMYCFCISVFIVSLRLKTSCFINLHDPRQQPTPHRNRNTQQRPGQEVLRLVPIIVPETDNRFGGNQETNYLVSTQQDEDQDEPALDGSDQFTSVECAGIIGGETDSVIFQNLLDEQVGGLPAQEGCHSDNSGLLDWLGEPIGRYPAEPVDTKQCCSNQ